MRILLVSYRFPPDTVGGVERYTQSLAAELAREGHEVTIAARRTEPGKANIRLISERLRDGTLLYRVVGPDIRFDRFLENHEQYDRILRKAMLETQPHVVHINHVMGFSPRIVETARQLGAATVFSLHDFFMACPRIHLQKPSGELCPGPNAGQECATTCFADSPANSLALWGLRSMYFSRTLARADAVIAYSDYVASYFERMNILTKPIHVIPNAVTSAMSESDELPAPDRKGQDLTIAYCGTVAAHKGPHVILEALQVARLGKVRLLLLGDAPERNYVQRLRSQAATIPGLDLKLYGKYERDELALLLRGVDCVVMPSLVPEAGPIVPREALACGVPVVVARLGALPEVIAEGENGFTFDPKQPQELAAILRRLSADPALVARLSAGAKQTPAWGVKEHAQRVLDVYDCALRDAAQISRDPKDISEFAVLHESVVRLGSDTSRAQTKSEGVLQ